MAEGDLRKRIEEVLNATARPLLSDGGGQVKLIDISAEGVARVSFLGACRSCPSTVMVIMQAIERELMKRAPEVAYMEVVAEK